MDLKEFYKIYEPNVKPFNRDEWTKSQCVIVNVEEERALDVFFYHKGRIFVMIEDCLDEILILIRNASSSFDSIHFRRTPHTNGIKGLYFEVRQNYCYYFTLIGKVPPVKNPSLFVTNIDRESDIYPLKYPCSIYLIKDDVFLRALKAVNLKEKFNEIYDHYYKEAVAIRDRQYDSYLNLFCRVGHDIGRDKDY